MLWNLKYALMDVSVLINPLFLKLNMKLFDTLIMDFVGIFKNRVPCF